MCALQPFLVDGTAAYLLGFSATFALILVAYLSKRQLRDLWGRAWEIEPTSELESRYSAGFWNTELCRVTIARSELATPDPNSSTDNRSEATWLSLPLGTETFQAIAATTAALPGNDFFSQFARELATLLGVQGAIVTELIGTNTYHTHSPSAKLKILGFWGQGWQPSSLEYPLANTPEAIAVKQGMYYCPDRLWEFFPDTGYLAILGACSFLGVSLTDSSGQLLGMIGIFHDQPLPTPDPALSILRIFGVRASAELERHRTQTALRQSEYRYYTLAKMLPVGIFRTDAIGDCLYVNEQYCELAGMMLTEALGEGWMRNLHPSDRSRVIADWEQAVQEKQPLKLEFRFQHAAGSETWVFCQAVPEIGETGEIVGYVGTLTDISDRKASEIALRQAEEKYRSIFENAIEGIFQITPKGHYLSANPALARIYGYESPEELMTKLHDLDRQLYVDPVRRSEFIRLVEEQGSVFEFESQVYRADGSKIWVSENARAVCDAEGQLLYYEGTVENITNRKVTEEKLVHEALHDTLTNLPNRSFFMERLQQSIDLAKRRQDYFFAVLFIDLDRFKVVNDSLGHLVGDKLLVAIAQRLEICLRSRDAVARLGGDEFAILLDGIKDANDATAVAERIQKKLALPFILDEYEVFTSASIGIVCSGWQPGKGALLGPMAPSQPLEIVNKGGSSPCLLKYERPEELLRDADAAMYHAKALGKARHEVFDLSMHTRAVALLQLENDLRRAVERHEFLLFYQPIVSLTNGGISGFEVLLRWQHPQRGLVAPGEFIQVAEETRLIVPIGWWMLRSACQQMREWQQQFPTNPPLTISVNLSNQQFTQPDLIEQIEQILTETGLEARSLKLEITESVIMENAESATALLAQLRALGVQLYIDDFGTGYSSLSRLHSFPTDALKIDRAFVSRMCIDEGNEAIVQTILILASHLGMDVIAEGVETAEQLAQLRALQCEYGQGYFFARPLDEKAASVLVASRPKW
ncbi:MAG: EAL domain-containing protein [Actinomycetota bacterium]